MRTNVDILVALAHREYETWFLTAARSLRGLRGLPEDLDPPPVAEGIRDAKGWLGARMNDAYDPITHQLEFTKQFELKQARANQSFDRLCNWIHHFLQEEVA